MFHDVNSKVSDVGREQVGHITFENCTFNISAGALSGQFDMKKLVSEVVAGIEENTKNNIKSACRVGVMETSYSQQSQTIKHIDFGSISDKSITKMVDNTMTDIVTTPQVPERRINKVVNPYKRNRF